MDHATAPFFEDLVKQANVRIGGFSKLAQPVILTLESKVQL